MEINVGDILQKGSDFFRIYSGSSNEIVLNRVFWNSIKERLEIYHDYDFCTYDDILNGVFAHYKSDDIEIIKKFEILKRKTKLKKLKSTYD